MVYNIWLHPPDTIESYDGLNRGSKAVDPHYIFHRAATPYTLELDGIAEPPVVSTGSDMLLSHCTTMASDVANGYHVTLVEVDNIPVSWMPNSTRGTEASITDIISTQLHGLDYNDQTTAAEMGWFDPADFQSCLKFVKERVTFQTLDEYRKNVRSHALGVTVAEIIKAVVCKLQDWAPAEKRQWAAGMAGGGGTRGEA